MKKAQDFTPDERKKYIGGSDIAAVMGMSRWTTPLQLWSYKTGTVEAPDLSGNERVEAGKRLEPVIADWFSDKTGHKIRCKNEAFRHPKYPFLVSHVDRIILNTDIILECKNTSELKGKEWKDSQIPYEYILQTNWNMGISGRKKAFVAVLIGGWSHDYVPLDFDEELFNIQVQAALEFWDKVQKKIMPDVTVGDNSFIAKLYPQTTDEYVQHQEVEERIAYRQELKMHIDDMKEEIDEIDVEIKETIGSNYGLETQKYKVIWCRSVSTKLNKELMLKDGLDSNKYVISTETRSLRVYSKEPKVKTINKKGAKAA